MHAMKAGAGLAILLLLAACQRPPVPAHDKPPEPQALARSMQAPLDKAKGIQKTLDEAERQRREETDE